jgi:hypothetical protein
MSRNLMVFMVTVTLIGLASATLLAFTRQWVFLAIQLAPLIAMWPLIAMLNATEARRRALRHR